MNMNNIEILEKYEENGMRITKYTKDGGIVSHKIVEQILTNPTEPQPTQEEIQAQTLLNTELLLVYKEIGM